MAFIVQFIFFLTQLLTWAIFIRAILSWFPIPRDNPIVEFIVQITEPILQPLRRVVPTLGTLDITPLVAILLLQLLGELAFQIL